MEGLAVDPVSWPWTSPKLLIDTQSESNHVLGELTHELSSPPTCCQSWVLLHSIMPTYRQRFSSVIQQTLWLLYSGGFDCACSQSSRTFFFFFLITHIYWAGWIQFWCFHYLLGSMSDPDMYDCFCLCPITRFIGCLSCFWALPMWISACLDALYWSWTYCARLLVWPWFIHYMLAKREQPTSFLIRAWRITEQTQPSVQSEGKGNPMHRRSCLYSIPILLTVGHLRLLVSSCSIKKTESVDENHCLWCKQIRFPRTFGLFEWETIILLLWLITAIVIGWYYTKCKTEGDESPQWHDSGWQRAVTCRGWIVEISPRFAHLAISYERFNRILEHHVPL